MPGSREGLVLDPVAAAYCGGNLGQLRRFEYEPTFALPLPLQGGEGQAVGDQLVAHRLPLLN